MTSFTANDILNGLENSQVCEKNVFQTDSQILPSVNLANKIIDNTFDELCKKYNVSNSNSCNDESSNTFSNISKILYEKSLKTYIHNASAFALLNLYFNKFNKIANDVQITIQKLLQDKLNFTTSLINIRENYYNIVRTLSKNSQFILNEFIQIPSCRILNVLGEYAFYSNVIDATYIYYKTDVELINCTNIFEIFKVIIELDLDVDFNCIAKFINQYFGFYFSFKINSCNNENHLFNKNVNLSANSIKLKYKSQVVKVIDKIDTLIRSLKNKTIKEYPSIVREIVNILGFANNSSAPDDFIVMYSNKLQKRLLDNISAFNIESELIKLFKLNNFNRTQLFLLNYVINDFINRHAITNIFNTITINFNPAHDPNDIAQFNKHSVKYTLLRKIAWTSIDHQKIEYYSKLVLPTCLKLYVQAFYTFYEKYFIPTNDSNCVGIYANRKILFDYTISTVTINLKFNSNTKYSFVGTVIQTCILIYIFNNKLISAHDLATLMNIPLKFINTEINSLLCANLILKHCESNELSDPNMKFSINSNFTSTNTENKINLCNYCEQFDTSSFSYS